MATIGLICVSLFLPFIITSYSHVSGLLVVGPTDAVVSIGQRVQLNCSTDDIYSVNWWHVPVGSSTNEDIFISRVVVLPYHPRFKVEQNAVESPTHEYNLVISSVRGEDAGKYTCLDRVGHGEQRHAQLVVLESSPQCQTNIVGEGFVGDNDCGKQPDEIHCFCSVEYYGNNPPVMEWTNSAGRALEPKPSVNTSQRNIISSNMMVKPLRTMNGTSIVWRAELLNTNNWTSADIKINYVMRNATEVNATIPGESIVCSANSSSNKCTYKWTMQNGTMVSEAPNLTIVNTGTYLCDATCSLHHAMCTVRSMVVDFRQIHEDNTKDLDNILVIVVITVIGIVSVFSTIFVILFCQRIKRRKMLKYEPCATDGEFFLLHQLKTENRMVVGVSILDELMYVAHHGSNVISVYRTTPEFELLKEITVDGLGEPFDMAASPLNRCLYITDSKNKCVWELHTSNCKTTRWMEKISEPLTISVCSNGHVLMAQQPNAVLEYNAEGDLVDKWAVDFGPRIQDIQHAVENEQGHFIIIHGGSRDKEHAICELSKDGRLIRSFGCDPGDGARQLSHPRHVAVDDRDRVYVVDAYNDRVLQLDKELQIAVVLPFSARSQPLRLAISAAQIFVGTYGALHIFSILDPRRLPKNGEYSAVPMNNSNA